MAGKGVTRREPPALTPGAYSDGHPLDTVHYLESKLILKPERFTSPPSFHEFGKLVARAAEELEVGFSTLDYKAARPRIREVVFLDTKDFTLYNHSFILRRRISYEDGFAVGDPEIVFKFRHPDLQTAAEMDVRPNIGRDYRIKFKAEALPLRERLGGYRLFSHNVEFELVGEVGRTSIRELAEFFPALAGLGKSNRKIDLVNHTIVEEVLQDLGVLDFGKGVAPSPMPHYGASAATTKCWSASFRSSASSNAGTIFTKRRESACGVSSSGCRRSRPTGFHWARPRPASSIG
jgi:hypothetical protein